MESSREENLRKLRERRSPEVNQWADEMSRRQQEFNRREQEALSRARMAQAAADKAASAATPEAAALFDAISKGDGDAIWRAGIAAGLGGEWARRVYLTGPDQEGDH